MNGAIDKLTHIANLRRRATTRRLLVRVGAPAMAVVGVGAIAAILVGLQCGGLDKCLAGARQATLTHAAPTAVLPAAPQAERAAIASAAAPVAAPAAPVAAPGASVAAPGASVAPAAPVAALTEVAMTRTPAVPEGVQRAQRVDQMIGNTFVALASDDAGWLAGATANAAADAETYAEGDGAGPPPQIGETAAEAADAIATGEAPVAPLQRPTPLDVTAFADAPSETAATVRAEAERKLAEVAKSQPEPEPEPKAAEPKAAEPTPAKAQAAKAEAAAAGDTRTVVGSGVNVRSGPGKSNGRAFGLVGGEKVTVGENQRGWLKITDDQGRTGWVYKDYLN